MHMRVAVLFDNFGPYHIARLSAAARRIDVLAIEAKPQSSVYNWVAPDVPSHLTFVRLASREEESRPTLGEIERFLNAQVLPFGPTALAVPGWSSRMALAAVKWARANGIPVVVMSESNADDSARFSGAEWIKRVLVKQFAAALCGGNRARNYLIRLGLPPAGIFLGYDVVDNAYFSDAAEAVKQRGAMPAVAPELQLDKSWRGRYFLASARFVEKKNLPKLLEGYARYRRLIASSEEAWPLIVLGDGPMRSALEQKRRALGLDGTVYFPGFMQYAELPSYYGSAGAFVHASSTEQWGLVVNEAMASGLPVAVSRRCGCAEMLVVNNDNGYTFEPSDSEAIAETLLKLADHPQRKALGAASAARIGQWGPDAFAEGLESAVRYARTRREVQASCLQRLVVDAAALIQGMRA